MNKVLPWQTTLIKSMADRGTPIMALRQIISVRIPFDMGLEQLSQWTSTDLGDLLTLNKSLRADTDSLIKENTPVKLPGKVLNVSYSEYGLTWTTDKFAKSLYYEDAYLKQTDKGPKFIGNLKRKSGVYVSQFVPKNHIMGTRMNHDAQRAEYFACNKAIHLIYKEERDETSRQDKQPLRKGGESSTSGI